jgi:hypothetical protein
VRPSPPCEPGSLSWPCRTSDSGQWLVRRLDCRRDDELERERVPLPEDELRPREEFDRLPDEPDLLDDFDRLDDSERPDEPDRLDDVERLDDPDRLEAADCRPREAEPPLPPVREPPERDRRPLSFPPDWPSSSF